jgi:hypothetical protein
MKNSDGLIFSVSFSLPMSAFPGGLRSYQCEGFVPSGVATVRSRGDLAPSCDVFRCRGGHLCNPRVWFVCVGAFAGSTSEKSPYAWVEWLFSRGITESLVRLLFLRGLVSAEFAMVRPNGDLASSWDVSRS